MKIISVKSLKNIDHGVLIAFFSLLTGIIIGIIIYISNESELKSYFNQMLIENCQNIKKAKISNIFADISTKGLIYFILLFISGSSLFGNIMPMFLIAFKYAGISSVITYMYSEHGIKGLEYILLAFSPGKIILTFSLLYMAQNCYKMSEQINSSINIKSYKKIYYYKSIFAVSMFLFSWITDTICIKMFSGILI